MKVLILAVVVAVLLLWLIDAPKLEQAVREVAATISATLQKVVNQLGRPPSNARLVLASAVQTPYPTPTPRPTSLPTVTPVPTSNPPQGCMLWRDFQSATVGIRNAYQLIDWLDTQPLKRDNPVGGYTVLNPVGQSTVLWTGLYVQDVTLGGNVVPYLVDGKTGVFVITGTNVRVPTPGGTLCVIGYDGRSLGASQNPPDTGLVLTATSCLPTSEVIRVINTWKASNPNMIYVELDRMVDNHQDARLRASGPATVLAENVQTLLWTRPGEISGQVLALDQIQGKALYIATADGEVNMTHAFSGAALCSDLNPERDFPWWGN